MTFLQVTFSNRLFILSEFWDMNYQLEVLKAAVLKLPMTCNSYEDSETAVDVVCVRPRVHCVCISTNTGVFYQLVESTFI